ncbi:MAG: penicillin-binding protein 2 [bacterium]|nr:penicillin-binding protein 2 [bacterium]MDZ4285662.1 penicillin-binding protein 2 [Candidatus Sungbacteria bacterium]
MKKAFDVTVRRRMAGILIFFCMLFAAIAARLFLLQIMSHRAYVTLAAKQHTTIQDITPERGSIFMHDKDGSPVSLAENRVYKTLVVSPKLVSDDDATAGFLAERFGLDKAALVKKFSNKDDEYEVIARKVESEKADEIGQKNLAGIFFQEEKLRSYPHGTLASQAVGFVSREQDVEEGRYGLERYYEKELAGEVNAIDANKNSSNFLLALGRNIVNPPKNGSDIYTTIDYNIQIKAEEVLNAVREKWQAPSGLVIVMEPQTGRILALAKAPAFDPNNYSREKDFSIFLNDALQANYELGSVIKPLIMSAALEERVVKPDMTYTDTGSVTFGKYTIKNFDEKAHGLQTMTQVIENSLNTGMVYVSRLLGKEKELDYLKRFGFGQKTNVDLMGEVSGNISALNKKKDIDYATASFGQGIAVTPLQVAAAIGAIANHGVLMQPYITDRIVDDSGNAISKNPVEVRRVISKETAETMTKMMIGVVRNGYENRAGIKGYFIAGKTGTAQIPKSGAVGYSDKVIHTFVGFAPAFDPKFLVLLELYDPRGNKFAANTLTPAFHDLAQFMLNYYEIPPDEK